jgi:hypothetical protein
MPLASVKNRNRQKIFDMQNSNRRKSQEESDDLGYYNNNAHRVSGKKGAHYRPFGVDNDVKAHTSTEWFYSKQVIPCNLLTTNGYEYTK